MKEEKITVRLQPQIARQTLAQNYILHTALRNAVEVAMALGQPLLLTGEPGTGKTELARRVAYDLSNANDPKGRNWNFASEPHFFPVKTTSAARDLFYTYDALSHFQAANRKLEPGEKALRTADFIELQALGLAIAQTNPRQVDASKFNTRLADQPQSSVVLIDEIDKAPRDFPNDLLDRLDKWHFDVREQPDCWIRKSPDYQVVVIMTSNSEKNLPDAFLRRCVFYDMPKPDRELLRQIVKAQLGDRTKFTGKLLEEMLDKFEQVRQSAVRKPPATAELIAWLRILEMQRFFELDDADRKDQQMLDNLSILVKTREDYKAVKSMFTKE